MKKSKRFWTTGWRKTNVGFTLIEVAISIFVLSMGTLTIIGVISDNLGVIGASKRMVIGSSLAQEGIEVVRNIRDTNWIEYESYDTGISPGDYCVDYNSTSLASCADYTLFWNGSAYNHSGFGNATFFSRRISISNQVDSDGISYIQVQSVVSWNNSQTTVETHLYDWK